MDKNSNTEALLYVEKAMKKKNFTYKDLAQEGNISPCTLYDFRERGTIPRENTVKKLAIILDINPDEVLKRLPCLNKKTRKVKVTVVCGHCGKPGTVFTPRPNAIKYPHENCARASSVKKSQNSLKSIKRTRDADRIKLMPQNEIYIRNAKKNKERRLCLSCSKTFLSRDIGNRIRKLCTNSLERAARQDLSHTVNI